MLDSRIEENISVSRKAMEKVEFEEEVSTAEINRDVDWLKLPDDIVIHLFSCLTYRDRASLALTCKTWRGMSASCRLWNSLDLRFHTCHPAMASSLASRCNNLQNLRFKGAESGDALIFLQASNLRDISGADCGKVTDATLSVIASRHELLECLQLGPDPCERITSHAIKQIAFCCPKLTKLRLSGIKHVQDYAINALGKHCPHLTDVGFLDCHRVDELALGNVASLRFLSLSGTAYVEWSVASDAWHKLPNLVGLDVSRTKVGPAAVSSLLISSESLKVLCALNCSDPEGDANFTVPKIKGKCLLSHSTDIFEEIDSLFADTTSKSKNVFWYSRNSKKSKNTHKSMDEMTTWLEGILSHTLLQSVRNNPSHTYDFWVEQGGPILLALMQSSQEDVQERATSGLGYLVELNYYDSTSRARAEEVMRDGGIRILLDLAKSCQEMLQFLAATAIAHLFANVSVSKAVVEEGGIEILTSLVRSPNRLVAQVVANGLWNLSAEKEHQAAIAEAGAVKSLVNLINKWPYDHHNVLESAAGALANLINDDKSRTEVALADGVHALIMLARNCELKGVQKQVARAFANIARHLYLKGNNATVGQEVGLLEVLIQMTRSPYAGVRRDAVVALRIMSFQARHRDAIASAGGVEALVALLKTCWNDHPRLPEQAALALWGLSISEAISVLFGIKGGVAPLIALARSNYEYERGCAACVLSNLAFMRDTALLIVEEGGVPTLVDLCSSVTKMPRFMAAIALAFLFDRSVDVCSQQDEDALVGRLDDSRLIALKQLEAYIQQHLAEVTERGYVQPTHEFLCSEDKIKRFISMLNLKKNPDELRAFAAFALLKLSISDGRHGLHHVELMQNAGAANVLHAIATDATAPLGAKTFARMALSNLEHHDAESSEGI